MQNYEVKSGPMPGTTKTYSDLELALASLYKAFFHFSTSADSDIRHEVYQLNGYLNTIARKYCVRMPHVLKAADTQWYMHAVPTLQSEAEVHNALNSFMTVFKIMDTEYLVPLSNHTKNLLQYGLFLEMHKN